MWWPIWGSRYRLSKGDTWSLDNGSDTTIHSDDASGGV